jgi:predicted HTH domain antitoxin
MQKGMQKGVLKGKTEGFLDAMISLVKDGILTLPAAAARAGMSTAEFEQKMNLKN